MVLGTIKKKSRHVVTAHIYPKSKPTVLASYMSREGKERKGTYVLMEKKIPFVGLESTPSAVRADVLIQLD